MSTVVVVSTGGTIAMRPDPATGKLVPAVSGDELVEMLDWPEAPPLELDDFVHVPSFDVHGALALSLATRVVEHAAAGRPTVVTHGTDTMEETAYLADLLLPASAEAEAVVFTGAQRGAEQRDADGPRNLRDAITVASSPGSPGRGALVVFAGEVHAAREARKVHTSALRAFASPGYGPLGHVDAGTVRYRRSPERPAPLAAPAELAQVDLIRLHAGSDGRFIGTAMETGARAIVLEGTGRGNGNDQVVAAVREAVAAGVAVVVCSRCAEGRVEPVYGRGGGRDLAEAGALFAGDLAGPKARVLLQVALGAGLDPSEALARATG
ncbi:MAG: asparaginase [Thermoleophilia bacterium]|nr:asparaginase [Thermoleophilia bacterium]